MSTRRSLRLARLPPSNIYNACPHVALPQASGDFQTLLREEGYRQALAEAERGARPCLVVACAGQHRRSGAQAMRRLLTLDPRPDAVFCLNDLLALASKAMAAIQEAGYRTSDDVAVVGFEDIEDGRCATPSLTTIAPDKEDIGRVAVRLLMGRIGGTRSGPPERIVPPFSLEVRRSTIGEASRGKVG